MPLTIRCASSLSDSSASASIWSLIAASSVQG